MQCMRRGQMAGLVLALSACMAATAAAAPARFEGICTSGERVVEFRDGIAYPLARDAAGLETVRVVLMSEPLDRKRLLACPGCWPMRELGAEAPWMNDPLQDSLDELLASSRVASTSLLQPAQGSGTVHGLTVWSDDGVKQVLGSGLEIFTLALSEGRARGTLTATADSDQDLACNVRFEVPYGWPRPESEGVEVLGSGGGEPGAGALACLAAIERGDETFKNTCIQPGMLASYGGFRSVEELDTKTLARLVPLGATIDRALRQGDWAAVWYTLPGTDDEPENGVIELDRKAQVWRIGVPRN